MTTTNTVTAVDKLLEAFAAGRGGSVRELYTDDAVLDATVPGWRFHVRGARAIAEQYSGWFADEGRFEELDRRPIAGGEVVTYLLAWQEDGVPHAAHHSHHLELDDTGKITFDRVFCGGRWNATELARMAASEAADNAG